MLVNWAWPVPQKGFVQASGEGSMLRIPWSFGALEEGRAMIQCDGTTALCRLHCLRSSGSHNYRLLRGMEQCEKPLMGNLEQLCGINGIPKVPRHFPDPWAATA